jgi:hypothetical protein
LKREKSECFIFGYSGFCCLSDEVIPMLLNSLAKINRCLAY